MAVELDLTEEEHLKLYRQMVLIRTFEERAAEEYTKGKITGFTHLYSGEEAVAVGAISALSDKDYVVSAYRDHGHVLVKGADAGSVMAELFGKATGLSHGRGGSMHLFDGSIRFMGGYGIVGGGLPISVGLAQAVAYRGEDEVVASFFGDGAVNQGVFHESLNMAKLWKLPLLLICENNFYGIGTSVGRASAVEDIYKRVCAYDMQAAQVDGMDVMAVRSAAERAVATIRSGKGPVFIEARTYRFRGHSMSDPDEYRSKTELKIWRERDPIPKFAKHLESEGITTAVSLKEIRESVDKEVTDAVAFADSSPDPPVADLMKNVNVEVGGHV